MKCPKCNSQRTRVKAVEDNIRRRECIRCDHRYNTKEVEYIRPLKGRRLAKARNIESVLAALDQPKTVEQLAEDVHTASKKQIHNLLSGLLEDGKVARERQGERRPFGGWPWIWRKA